MVAGEAPETYKEAMQGPEAKEWQQACNDEMLKKNATWQLVDLPRNGHAIGCKWILAKKEDLSERSGMRYKARLVAKGCSQK